MRRFQVLAYERSLGKNIGREASSSETDSASRICVKPQRVPLDIVLTGFLRLF